MRHSRADRYSGRKDFQPDPRADRNQARYSHHAGKNNGWVVDQFEKSGLDIEITIDRRNPQQSDPAAPLLMALRAIEPKIADYIFYGGCDMSFATAPAVVMGPGRSERSHAADEFIVVSEIAAAIEIYAHAAMAFFAQTSTR